MNKLLQQLDKHILKIGIAFLIVFTALYPKLPSVHIIRTWVYIRLEDFSILGVAILWFIQLLRKKVTIPFRLSFPIFAYWAAGLVSLLFSLVFIGPHLLNFFPHVAALEYLRRIEYMILFFIALSTVTSSKDVRDYLVILFLTVAGIVIYGFGQHYYVNMWAMFPQFFEKYSFCFPSFQTGNEEFAKGLPLCLPADARITSTFGGHYDLAAYLVMVLPIILAVGISLKKISQKILLGLLFVSSVMLLAFTASRISFAAYIVGSLATLIFYKKKWYIIPVLILSVLLLVTTSKSLLQRFSQTFRFISVVTNQQGQVVGETSSTLPQDLKNKISKNDLIEQPLPATNLQPGTVSIGIPEKSKPVATSEAVIRKTLTSAEAEKLHLSPGATEISTVSGNFLIKKALVYDISFTTRFQAEWPNAWNAFLRNPLLGSGYSSITLATDNDYFRALGETGLLGAITFFSIFFIFGIVIKQTLTDIKTPFIKAMLLGLAGGGLGLLINGTLIDVYESSKVAENLWILSGIGAGSILLYNKQAISYMKKATDILFSNTFISIYLLVLGFAAFSSSISNFFVADDFTWLKWAAPATVHDLLGYFTNSTNFFYRPIDKTIVFILWNLFSFQPEGYHIFIILLHFLVTIAVYSLGKYIFKRKLPAFFSATIFLLLPAHGENIYWFSTISVMLCSLLILYSILAFIRFRTKQSKAFYLLSCILAICAFLSYELAVILPLLLVCIDMLAIKQKKLQQKLVAYIPFILLVPIYFAVRILTHAFTGGGDYSYSLPHFIPNVVGNSIGYIGLFIAGEKFLPLYSLARADLKQSWLLITLVLFILFIAIAAYIVKNKTKLNNILKNESIQISCFGLIFGILSLLPYIALGNIAERYLYLSSVGFVFTMIVVIEKIAHTALKTKTQATMLFTAFVLGILILYSQQISLERVEWQKAGESTRSILASFRNDYADLSATDNIYLANVPQKRGNAWVFPVGLPDGLWFIYRERTPNIYQVQTVKDAKDKILRNNTKSNYIFTIDETGKVTKVQ